MSHRSTPRPAFRRGSRRTASRRAGTLAATLAVLVGLTACAGGSAQPDDTSAAGGGDSALHVLRANPFEGFDLDAQTLNATFQLSLAVIEPLIRVAPDGESLEPGLAASWEYDESGTALTITLADATFSDGSPVTADDVAFSVESWKSGANYGATYSVIDSTEVVDPQTIVFHLAYPDVTVPAYLSWSSAGIVPADFGGRDAEEFWQEPIGAGAFTVASWSANGDVVLEANPGYYREGYPLVAEVVSTYAADANSASLQLQSGEADIVDRLDAVTAASLPAELVDPQGEHTTPVLLMNTSDPALADPAVRQAIGWAIDYQSIVDGAFKGYGVVPTGALPTNVPGWEPPSQAYFSHDPAAAEALLASADAPTSVTLTYGTDPSTSLIAQIIQDNLAAVGIEVSAEPTDSGSSFGAIAGGDYQLGLFSYNAISPEVADPAWYVAATSTMFTGLPSDDLVGLLSEYGATADEADQAASIVAVQDLLFDQAPFIALAHTQHLLAVRDGVSGVNPAPWGVYPFDTVEVAD